MPDTGHYVFSATLKDYAERNVCRMLEHFETISNGAKSRGGCMGSLATRYERVHQARGQAGIAWNIGG